MNTYILRYGEISLKGKNRYIFEKKLVHNLKTYIKGIEGKIQRLHNRLFAETEKDVDWKPVFGLISYSPCQKIPYEKINETVDKLSSTFNKKTRFRITTHKMDARFPESKQEMNEKLGALVIQKTCAKVDLKNYEEEIGIELLQGNAYIYRQTNSCLGGLPVGVEGNVLLLIEDEHSLLAGLLAMKRGCALFPVAKEKKDLALIEKYAYGTKPALRLLDEINPNQHIQRYELQALVVGDTIGKIKEYPEINLPVLRPLIGFTPEKIKEELKKYP